MKFLKFQQGGPMPMEDPAAQKAAMAQEQGAPVEGQDPMQMIVEGAMEAVQTNNGDLALQVCAALVQLVQESAGAPAEEPVFRNGGVLAYRCGGKSKKVRKGAGGCDTKKLQCGKKIK